MVHELLKVILFFGAWGLAVWLGYRLYDRFHARFHAGRRPHRSTRRSHDPNRRW